VIGTFGQNLHCKSCSNRHWTHNDDVLCQMTLAFVVFTADRVKPLVVGSLGPYGACQADCSEYSGDYVDNMSVEVSKKR